MVEPTLQNGNNNNNNNNNMTLTLMDLGKDVLYHMMEYLPCHKLTTFYHLGQINRFFSEFVLEDPMVDGLFPIHGNIVLGSGPQQQQNNHSHPNKRYWKNIYHFQKTILLKSFPMTNDDDDDDDDDDDNSPATTRRRKRGGRRRGRRQQAQPPIYFLSATKNNHNKKSSNNLQQQQQHPTLGVLSQDQELASLLFDTPTVIMDEEENNGEGSDDDEDDEPRRRRRGRTSTPVPNLDPCMGYFGFQLLPQEVAVWGDFAGVAFFPSWSSVIVGNNNNSENNANDKEASPLRLPAIKPPPQPQDAAALHNNNNNNNNNNNKIHSNFNNSNQCNGKLFSESLQVMAALLVPEYSILVLGFASGDIHAISLDTASTTTTNGDHDDNIQEYPHLAGTTSQHENEITSLTRISTNHLASGSVMSSQVVIHWNAFVEDNEHGYCLDHTSVVHYEVESILSIAATSSTATWNRHVADVAMTVGSSDGTMYHSAWCLSKTCQLQNPYFQLANRFNIPIQKMVLATQNNSINPIKVESLSVRAGHIVFLKYYDQDIYNNTKQGDEVAVPPPLVVGTNLGALIVVDSISCGDGSIEERYVLEHCCPAGSCVESVEWVGSKIMLTCGGNNGQVKLWEWSTGHALGVLQVHPGRAIASSSLTMTTNTNGRRKRNNKKKKKETMYYSSVVKTQFCHERSSLICLCRDGYVGEWTIIQDTIQNNHNNNANNSKASLLSLPLESNQQQQPTKHVDPPETSSSLSLEHNNNGMQNHSTSETGTKRRRTTSHSNR